VDLVVTSPLIRAIETATAIAGRHDLLPRVDRRLTESGQFPHWTGHRWESISTLYPGELESYLDNAADAGGTEQLGAIAQRYRSVAEEAVAARYTTLAIVGHQDPIQAARLSLTGRDLRGLRLDPPHHGEAIKLTRSDQGEWTEVSRWSPQVAAPEAQRIL
jgi:broad specificity phosphatase PhoE